MTGYTVPEIRRLLISLIQHYTPDWHDSHAPLERI